MRINWKRGIIEVIILSFAVLIIAASVYFFLIPSKTTISSISAVAVVISHYVPLPVSAINMIINVFLLILGFFLIGREFGIKTVYTSILLPVYLAIFERVWPDIESLTGSDIIDVIACIFFISMG